VPGFTACRNEDVERIELVENIQAEEKKMLVGNNFSHI
jgi:sRNA-binding carbon storage regulator CsrA